MGIADLLLQIAGAVFRLWSSEELPDSVSFRWNWFEKYSALQRGEWRH
jgi:hypothetical protein